MVVRWYNGDGIRMNNYHESYDYYDQWRANNFLKGWVGVIRDKMTRGRLRSPYTYRATSKYNFDDDLVTNNLKGIIKPIIN